MKQIFTIIFSLTALSVYCQTDTSKIIGIYSNDITKLILKADGTFSLNTPDYVFPYTFKNYQTSGKWVCLDKEVILNPDKTPRTPVLTLTERTIENVDSIEIKINYQTEEYENEVSVKKEKTDFDLMTLYLNKDKNYIHLVHSPRIRICAFTPKVKRQHILDSSNTIKLPLQKLEKIGVYTYGFDTKKELVPQSKTSNYFEITILQPVDKERTPRNKKIIFKGNKVFFYENKGDVITTGLLTPLKKIE